METERLPCDPRVVRNPCGEAGEEGADTRVKEPSQRSDEPSDDPRPSCPLAAATRKPPNETCPAVAS